MLRPDGYQRKCPSNALEKGQRLHYRTAAERPTGCHPGGGAKTFAETATAGEWQGKTLREQRKRAATRL
nr:Alkaline phosphatase precursor [Klebsiella pneumoniae]